MTDKQEGCNRRRIGRLTLTLFDMSEDITASLLAQYYGISEEPELNKFPSIQCIGSIENDSDKLIGEQSTVDTNGDDTSKETEMQVRILILCHYYYETGFIFYK